MKKLILLATLLSACSAPEVVLPPEPPPVEEPAPPTKQLPPDFDMDKLCRTTCQGQGFVTGRWCSCETYTTMVCVCAYEETACEDVTVAVCKAP